MLVITVISQALIYLCVGLCIGHFILSIVKSSAQPKIEVHLNILRISIIGIVIFSFVPILQNVLFLSSRIGFIEALKTAIFTFEIGKAWILIFFISIVFLKFIHTFDQQRNKLYGIFGLSISISLILILGWFSHASSIDRVWGFIGDTLHLLAVSVWVGTLIVVSWFSKNHENWFRFLKWYTPIAIVCLLVTIFTGVLLMNFMVDFEEYTNSWLIPYGQALLWKHLLIIPLLVYAFINGIFIHWRLKKIFDFNPIPWARIESIIILLIFSATAALGEQSPPKVTPLKSENLSSLFQTFYHGQVAPDMIVNLSLNWTSVSLLILSILFLALIIFSYIRKVPALFSFLMSLCLVFCVYLSLMFSIQ